MTIKFNGGNGAFLCDKCSKIVYTFSNVPKKYLKKYLEKPDSLKDIPLLCETCK